jgi:acetolactate synthase-1/2/3 large subunit
VTRTGDFPAALAEAMASGMPAIVHVKMSTDAILPGASLTSIRNKALASR